MRHTPTTFAVSDALSVYLLDHQANKHSQRTVEHYKVQLSPFVAWLSDREVRNLHEILPNHIRYYLVERIDRGLSQYTVNTSARALRAFFNFCVHEEWLGKSPMTGMKMPKLPKPMPTVLTVPQVKQLISLVKDERDRAIVLLILDTGVRASELCALDGGDIDIGAATVHVRNGKGNKGRYVYLGAKSVKALLRYYAVRGVPKQREPIWLSQKRKERLSIFGLAQMLERYGNKLGYKCNAHMLRRTFATESLRAGMSLFALQRLMGHEDSTVLKHYLQLLDDDLRDAHRRFGVVDNL